MGGTRLLKPIQQAMSGPRRKNHPRSIFVLTGGAVSNTSAVLKTMELEMVAPRNWFKVVRTEEKEKQLLSPTLKISPEAQHL